MPRPKKTGDGESSGSRTLAINNNSMNILHPFTLSILLFFAQQATFAKSIRPEGFKLGTPLNPLGAKMETGVGLKEIESYSRVFGFTDKDKDGKHSKVEYVDNGNYLNLISGRNIQCFRQ